MDFEDLYEKSMDVLTPTKTAFLKLFPDGEIEIDNRLYDVSLPCVEIIFIIKSDCQIIYQRRRITSSELYYLKPEFYSNWAYHTLVSILNGFGKLVFNEQ